MAAEPPPREPSQEPWPPQPVRLDYGRAGDPGERPSVRPAVQAVLGVIAVVASLAASVVFTILGGAIVVALVILFGVTARARWRWRTFLATYLIGVGLCVLTVGVCFVALAIK